MKHPIWHAVILCASVVLILLIVVAARAEDMSEQDCLQLLVDTRYPSGSMERQGVLSSLARLHPKLRENLCEAFVEAQRQEPSLKQIGVFSAYREPRLGIGGFADKADSCHAYGAAVDVAGIGGPGSESAKRWHQIAKRHDIRCIYGPFNVAEWNHCQLVETRACGRVAAVRRTVAPDGPPVLAAMFGAIDSLLAGVFGRRGMEGAKWARSQESARPGRLMRKRMATTSGSRQYSGKKDGRKTRFAKRGSKSRHASRRGHTRHAS